VRRLLYHANPVAPHFKDFGLLGPETKARTPTMEN
jgi:hypothetical protein